MPGLRLIVGLGNPGPRYQSTRHNVGANFVAYLAQRFELQLAPDAKFKGYVGRGNIAGHDVRLLVPTTFMNLSGESVGALVGFYKFDVDEVLVAYDEMAFEPGVLRLKTGGGDNGHNGIRNLISGLGNARDFHRLRIGVGHPDDRSQVTAFLTSHRMPEAERKLIESSWQIDDALLGDVLAGNLEKAMNDLHSSGSDDEEGERGET
ncbi:MAG: aminoacyl-tRNA hydrolase [Pseudomonadales bacterium]|jgi:PTH1 family peptidyl-tRNA hydrolase